MPDKEISPGVFIAGDDQIKQYPTQVDALLAALGHPEALVTDLSTFSDFCGSYDDPQAWLDENLKPLGLKGFVTIGTTLLDAAKLLTQRTPNQGETQC